MDQETADYLLKIEKRILNKSILFPLPNNKLTLNVKSLSGNEIFLLDINRAGIINISRCTFQERYNETILIRLDLDKNKLHKNPDNKIIKGPHLHIYQKDFGDRWAYSLSEMNPCPFSDISDLHTSFIEFCRYCNINNIPAIQMSF